MIGPGSTVAQAEFVAGRREQPTAIAAAVVGMLLDVDELKDAFRASSSRNEGRRATATMRT
jgi:hypothetical protein